MEGTQTAGTNGPPPLTEDELLTFNRLYDDADSAIGAAREACKAPLKAMRDLKKQIGNRMSLDAFLRAREDRFKPGVERDETDRVYRQIMAWFGKPVGHQGMFEFRARDAGEGELQQIGDEGYSAGKSGEPGENNPWAPGDARYVAWDNRWRDGREEFLADQQRLAEGQESTTAAPRSGTGRPRGRPRGSGTGRGPGRPRGTGRRRGGSAPNGAAGERI